MWNQVQLIMSYRQGQKSRGQKLIKQEKFVTLNLIKSYFENCKQRFKINKF